jgi:hypothetical protein
MPNMIMAMIKAMTVKAMAITRGEADLDSNCQELDHWPTSPASLIARTRQ